MDFQPRFDSDENPYLLLAPLKNCFLTLVSHSCDLRFRLEKRKLNQLRFIYYQEFQMHYFNCTLPTGRTPSFPNLSHSTLPYPSSDLITKIGC